MKNVFQNSLPDTLFPALRSWQEVLNFSHISIKPNIEFQPNSNILVFPETGKSNCLLYV